MPPPETTTYSDYFKMGTEAAARNDFPLAVSQYQKAVELKPDFVSGHCGLALMYVNLVRLDEAEISASLALKYNPKLALAYCILSDINRRRGKIDLAENFLKKSIGLNLEPATAALYSGRLLKSQGKIKEAADQIDLAIKINPKLSDAYLDRAMLRLLTGELEQGWADYESRLTTKKLAIPRWDGADFKSKTLLLYSEQGFGDVIQFIRFIPLAKAKGGKIIFACHKELLRLLQDFNGIDELIHLDQLSAAADNSDLQVPLMSLPLIFHTGLANIPSISPYLRIDQGLIDQWGNVLNEKNSFKIGLCWAGNPKHLNDLNRSCLLSDFAPLAKLQNVTFYSLQKGEKAREATSPPSGMKIIDLNDTLKDFRDTAAVIANLDLVISVDTVIVHLTGALGKAIWVALPFDPDWRWLLKRSDSPWYPTAKLFRQSEKRQWQEVFMQINNCLKASLPKSIKPI